MTEREGRFVAFARTTRIAEGDWAQVSRAAWRGLETAAAEPVLVFDATTGRVADLDPRDRAAAVETAEVAAPELAKRGRPKLGVVAREVTLLPRHWDWLAQQPGGASVTLRRLVEAARKEAAGADDQRAARDAAYRFMQAIGGDLPGFEEASRVLFADDMAAFSQRIADWPRDVRNHLLKMLGLEVDR